MYDLVYLSELHRKKIFESIKEKGYTTEYAYKRYAPGVFRPAMSPTGIRAKRRYYGIKDATIIVVYSQMDEKTVQAADKMLQSIKVDELAKLTRQEFGEAMAGLYADLDFLHPFIDGNSRTLRAFISEVAREAGFEIDWEKYDLSQLTQDELYAARDIEVNLIALREIDLGVFRDPVKLSIVKLQDFKSLYEIFDEITQRINRFHEKGIDKGIELD